MPRYSDWNCEVCETDSTPMRRAGFTGTHSMCNACGIRYKRGTLLVSAVHSAVPRATFDTPIRKHKKKAQHKPKNHKQPHPALPYYDGLCALPQIPLSFKCLVQICEDLRESLAQHDLLNGGVSLRQPDQTASVALAQLLSTCASLSDKSVPSVSA